MGSVDTGATLFKIERSDLNIQVHFGTYFWSLVHDIPKFYTALLLRLGEFGVNPTSIRSETGENLGAYNVNFWMASFKINIKIRLERMEFSFSSITGADSEIAEKAFLALMQALADSDENFQVAAFNVDWALHGFPEGVAARDVVGRFVKDHPAGMGPAFGAGAIFYFGEKSVERTVTIDLSGPIPDALFVRLNFRTEGPPPTSELGKVFTEPLFTGLNGVGLRIQS